MFSPRTVPYTLLFKGLYLGSLAPWKVLLVNHTGTECRLVHREMSQFLTARARGGYIFYFYHASAFLLPEAAPVPVLVGHPTVVKGVVKRHAPAACDGRK